MRETNKEDLKQAYKSEKDPRIKIRILAVHMVRVRKKGIDETAADLMQSERWVHNWLRRYDEGGLDNLRDLPRPGRPRAVPQETIDRIIDEMIPAGCTPAALQGRIHREAGRKLHITYIRKMMRNRGLSTKRLQKVHINRADRKAVRNWQYRVNRLISCLEGIGFAVVMEDEAFFMHDVITGRKYWSPHGQRIGVPYTGSHRKITVYGSLARDGRQFFRTYDRFNASTFLLYLKEMQKHFGKVTVITDRASPHRSRLVRKFLRANRNVRILYFPKSSPHLNAVEECWHQGKRVLLVSEYYRTFSDMCRAVSTYYRTARFNLELLKYANRKTELVCRNL